MSRFYGSLCIITELSHTQVQDRYPSSALCYIIFIIKMFILLYLTIFKYVCFYMFILYVIVTFILNSIVNTVLITCHDYQ